MSHHHHHHCDDYYPYYDYGHVEYYDPYYHHHHHECRPYYGTPVMYTQTVVQPQPVPTNVYTVRPPQPVYQQPVYSPYPPGMAQQQVAPVPYSYQNYAQPPVIQQPIQTTQQMPNYYSGASAPPSAAPYGPPPPYTPK